MPGSATKVELSQSDLANLVCALLDGHISHCRNVGMLRVSTACKFVPFV